MHCLCSKYTCKEIIFTVKVLIIMPNQTAWANVVLTFGANTNYVYLCKLLIEKISHIPPSPPLNTHHASKEIDE